MTAIHLYHSITVYIESIIVIESEPELGSMDDAELAARSAAAVAPARSGSAAIVRHGRSRARAAGATAETDAKASSYEQNEPEASTA